MMAFEGVIGGNFTTNVASSLPFHVSGHVSEANVAANVVLLCFLCPEIKQTRCIKALFQVMRSCIIHIIIQFMNNSHEIM